MEYHYKCPHCDSYLRVRENIIISFKAKKSENQGIILLNPELGNYGFIVHDTVIFEKDEVVDFYCPICAADLSAKEINPKLVNLTMIDKNGVEYDIFFSRVAGEHSTFKVDKENIIEKFGKNASSYLGYFTSKLKKQMEDRSKHFY